MNRLAILACFLLSLLLVSGCQGQGEAEEGGGQKEHADDNAEKGGSASSGEEGPGDESAGDRKTAADPAKDVKAIKAVFESFRQAVLNRDGQAALKLASSNSIDRYERVRQLALAGAAGERLDEIRESPLGDRVMIAMMLLRLGEQRLKPLTGEELFTIGIRQGWIGRRSFKDATLGKVTVMENGLVATSPLMVKGEEQDASWRFVKEDDGWKLDLTALMQFADVQMRKAARGAGLTEDELVQKIVEDTDDVVVRDVWLPWSPPDGGFSVDLPTPAKQVEGKDATDDSKYWISRSVQYNAAYMVNTASMVNATEPAEEIVDNTIRGIVASSKGELVGVEPFEQGGLSGKQLQLKMPKEMVLTGRVFVHHKTLYQLLVVSEAKMGVEHLKRFFSSFRVEGE